ncbi:OmpH family outer membrane protein [Proteiniphilum acetatigenes]|uniref:OmpH family outer membrane protein n=1 Tax=Proteiniphilum acetatigenes TaxID=294710 RepID=UPI00039B1182|nr:OmpH family outer membrane protein [Proteiniphilum acetatigenes]SFK33048.1 periplasmic chaperone for outer membrane proteins Skp [Porphyromonadaceae bacterium KH3CP3RA]
MTKRVFFTLTLLISLVGGTAFSQVLPQVSVAYVNTTELLDQMPEKAQATQQLLTLSENYEKELELMQNEYNKKYSDYITYQASLSENIKLRRMQELTELESRITQFMELAQKDIENREKELLEPLKQKINNAIHNVGVEQGYTVIYDLANPGIAFVSPDAVNANPYVKSKLGIR